MENKHQKKRQIRRNFGPRTVQKPPLKNPLKKPANSNIIPRLLPFVEKMTASRNNVYLLKSENY